MLCSGDDNITVNAFDAARLPKLVSETPGYHRPTMKDMHANMCNN